MTAAATPLRRRPLDLVLCVLCAAFACAWVLSDVPKALGIPTDGNRHYAEWIDPMFLAPPPALRFILLLSGCTYGPCYLLVAIGLARDARWLPRLAVPFALVVETTTIIYIVTDVTGPTPPLRLGAFLGLNGPYAIVPLLLLYRCLRDRSSRTSRTDRGPISDAETSRPPAGRSIL